MTNEEKREGIAPLYRVIDANFNRFKEAIRVIEDINRYVYNNKSVATQLKTVRHSVVFNKEFTNSLLQSRDAEGDVLKSTLKEENVRTDLRDVMIANYRRGEESARVLEEIFKIVDGELSEKFKASRYRLYSLEKRNLLVEE
jgi:thiamine-phosphate pyrophosphorylase